MLCQVHLTGITEEKKQLLDTFFFHPFDKLEERNGALVMNYGGGKLCRGNNDFGEGCKDCRFVPYFVRKILKRQKVFVFGKEGE